MLPQPGTRKARAGFSLSVYSPTMDLVSGEAKVVQREANLLGNHLSGEAFSRFGPKLHAHRAFVDAPLARDRKDDRPRQQRRRHVAEDGRCSEGRVGAEGYVRNRHVSLASAMPPRHILSQLFAFFRGIDSRGFRLLVTHGDANAPRLRERPQPGCAGSRMKVGIASRTLTIPWVKQPNHHVWRAQTLLGRTAAVRPCAPALPTPGTSLHSPRRRRLQPAYRPDPSWPGTGPGRGASPPCRSLPASRSGPSPHPRSACA